MSDKTALHFILSSTPRSSKSPRHWDQLVHSLRATAPMVRRYDGLQRYGVRRESHFRDSSPLLEDSRYTFGRPLTAYLRYAGDAPRVDRVRMRPVISQDVRHDHSPVDSSDAESQVTEPCDGTLARKSSKYCIVEGCMSRAKHARKCWKHGGSVKCKVANCTNRAKSKGVCWSHGGGSPCSVEDCGTIAVSNGYCWAHGGGKRCRERGCSRPAYERTRNYCAAHYQDLEPATALR